MLSAPPKPFRELPNYSWSDFDSVTAVKSAIRALEYGQLDQAALICDAMRRDDRIAGCLDRRTQALPALPFHLEPGTGRRAGQVMELVEANFERMFPDGVLSELQIWGVMLGLGIGQLLWEGRDGLWWPTLRIWHPRFAYWRWDDRAWHTNTEGQTGVVLTPGDGQWVMLSFKTLERAFMFGSARHLYVPWLLRQWAMRDWGRWSEVYGSPLRVAKTPAAADEADKQRFLSELAMLGSESVIRLPGSADPLNQFAVELMEAKSTGSDGFNQLIGKAETSIAVALLGQNLTTEVKGGSFSAAQVHESIRAEILQADAQLVAKCLREQVLKPWAAFNFGDPELAPQLRWSTDPPEDKVQSGLALKGLGEGITALQNTGAKPDVDELLERAGVPTTGPAEERPAPQAQPGQLEPEAVEPKDGADGEQPVAANSVTAALSRVKPSGALRGQLYVDDVTDATKRAGQRILAPDVSKLLEAVLHATDFEDLRHRVVESFGAMHPEALAKVMAQAMTMAELAGRVSALEDIGK
jgi:phage gp29-like protein